MRWFYITTVPIYKYHQDDTCLEHLYVLKVYGTGPNAEKAAVKDSKLFFAFCNLTMGDKH